MVRRGEETSGEATPLILSSLEIGTASDGGLELDVLSGSSASTIRTNNHRAAQHPLKRPAPADTAATSASASASASPSQPTDNGSNSCEVHASHHHHHGTGTVIDTALNSAKTCMGTGTLALPYAASSGGYLFNLIGLLVISLWNLWSVNRLIHCGELMQERYGNHGASTSATSAVSGNNAAPVVGIGENAQHALQPPTSFQREQSTTSRHRRTGSSMRRLFRDSINASIVEEEVQWSEESILIETQSPPPGTSTYGRVAWYALGPIGLHIMDAALLVLLLGVVIAYEDAIMSFLRETPMTTGSAALDSLCTILVIAPLTCVEDLHFLSKTSALGIVIIFVSFGVIFVFGWIENSPWAGLLQLSWEDMWPASLTGLCNWFGVTVFGFGAVPITYNLQESMKELTEMSRATEIALLLVGGAYAVIGNGVAILYKPSVEFTGDVLQELPESWIPTTIRLAMSFVLMITAPILLVPCAELIEGKLGLSEEPGKRHHRIMLRFGLCFFCAGISFLVPAFVHVISFIGAFCVVLTSFIFPPLVHLALVRQRLSAREGVGLFKRTSKELKRVSKEQDESERQWRRMVQADALFLVLGIIVSLIASTLTFIDLTKQVKTNPDRR